MCRGEQVFVETLGPHGRFLDACMVDVIRKLRDSGTETIGCCCGHGKYPMTVVYRAANGNAIEYFSSTILLGKDGKPKRRKFYVLDDEGIYFIPEVTKNGWVSER